MSASVEGPYARVLALLLLILVRLAPPLVPGSFAVLVRVLLLLLLLLLAVPLAPLPDLEPPVFVVGVVAVVPPIALSGPAPRVAAAPGVPVRVIVVEGYRERA